MKPSKLRPFFAYLTDDQYASLKQFSAATGVSMTQLIRESIDARLSKGDQYVAGYNQAIQDAILKINSNNLSKMAFPSGKTFGEVIIEDISANLRSQDGTGNGTASQVGQAQEDQGGAADSGAAA
jgi:uncharacterized secreted protein with C-terminal beta-propeller domain